MRKWTLNGNMIKRLLVVLNGLDKLHSTSLLEGTKSSGMQDSKAVEYQLLDS